MNWNWSFHGFRVWGVDVRIHWSLLVFFLYYVLRGFGFGVSLVTLGLFVILPMLLLFGSVVLHELGHVTAARAFGLHVGHMILTPIGGMVMVAQGRTPTHELVVAAAGPAVNLALATVGSTFYLAVGGFVSLGLALPFVGSETLLLHYQEGHVLAAVLFDFVQTQMGLFLFNIVVAAYPMDGGRILMSLLWRRRGFHGALALSCKAARIIAVVLGLLGLVLSRTGLIFIGVFVYFQAQTTLVRAPLVPDPGVGYDAGFARALHQQRTTRRIAQRKKRAPSRFVRWWQQRRERRIRRLLAMAEIKGIASLSNKDRAWLKKVRKEKRG